MVDVIVESAFNTPPLADVEPSLATKLAVTNGADPLIGAGLAIDNKRIGDANPCHTIQKAHTTAEIKLVKKKRPRAKSTKVVNERSSVDQGYFTS